MSVHRDNRRFAASYSLESTCDLLQRQFAHTTCMLVRPSYMHLGTFAAYRNFMHTNDVGVPTHDQHGVGWTHLHQLFVNCVPDAHNASVTLVAFSKGASETHSRGPCL